MNRPTSSKSGFAQFWDRQSPKRKQIVVAVAAVAGFVLLAYGMASSTDTKPRQKSPTELTNLLTSADTRQLGLSGMQNDVERITGALAKLTERLDRLERQGGSSTSPPLATPPATTVVPLPTASGAQPVDAASPAIATPPGTSVGNRDGASPANPFVRSPGAPPNGRRSDVNQPVDVPKTPPPPPPPPPQIMVIDSHGARAAGSEPAKAGNDAPASPAPEEPGVFIPAGSMLSGPLITGVDAPTGQRANAEPLPALIRIKREAILPNFYRVDVRECFVVVAAYGDLPSERAYMRSESLSCVRTDGRVLEMKIEMYAAGEDGKAGLRGRLVNKQGALIAKMLFAGFADGMAKALQPYRVPVIATSSGGTAQFQDVGADAGRAGLYGGASSALEKLSDHYMKLADAMTPVVEVDAGRSVTLIVLKGAELKLVPAAAIGLPTSVAWANSRQANKGG